MNVGDRVRLMRGKEEGIIVGVKENIIEIEIEDGFVIPAARNEVVLVSKQEALIFSKPDEVRKEERKNQVFSETGIFLAMVPTSGTTFDLYVINNTDYTLAITLFQDHKSKFKGIFSQVLSFKTGELACNFSSTNDELPDYILQGLYFLDQMPKIKEPFVKRIKTKPSIVSSELKKAPIINKDSYLIQIDGPLQPINTNKIKESLELNQAKSQAAPIEFKSPGKEIDLHIEKLVDEWENLSNSQILDLQLTTFENALDRAIASGQNEIKFIHGMGNGVLRTEIQKRLSKMKNIKFFEDTMKSRFGHGATLVKIK